MLKPANKKLNWIRRAKKKKITPLIGIKRKATSGLKQIKNLKPSVYLNLEHYAVADGVYYSYWVGKLISMLLRKGNKKIVAKHVYQAFAFLKYALNSSPLIILLEILDKIKPTFRLRNYIVRRVIIKEYPTVAYRSRLILIAMRWLKSEIQSSDRSGQTLSQKIIQKLLDFRLNPKKNSLIKKRAVYTKRIILGQFNIIYS